MTQTLESVVAQTLDNWDIGVAYDPSTDGGGDIIEEWCAKDPDRRSCMINTSRKFAIRNHYETLLRLDPQDDDIIVFLDLDGDMLAHPRVLERLRDASEEGALVMYGQYKPVPDMGTSGPAVPYPRTVVAANSYRSFHVQGGAGFNHPRCMTGRIFRAIPESMFKWQHGGAVALPGGETFAWQEGDFLEGSTDYVFMVCALELAGGRYKCFDEVMLLYNHANPLADNKTHPQQAHVCLRDFYSRAPLQPLPAVPKPVPEPELTSTGSRRPQGWTDIYLPAETRREIIRDIGAERHLRVFIETGTNDGGTPMFLKDDFDELHTIELGRHQYEAAVRLFAPYPQVRCWHGDSGDILPTVLAGIDRPALVWLDGHWSGGDTARGALDTPVKQELKILLADRQPHVVLVDDARLFKGGLAWTEEFEDWPSLSWVQDLAASHRYRYELVDDIIRLTPA